MAGHYLHKVIRIPEPFDFIGLAGGRLGGGEPTGLTARLNAAHRVLPLTSRMTAGVQRR